MSKLSELFLAVKDGSLLKDKLEEYHKELSELYQQMHMELGEVKKKKALYMLNWPPETSNATIVRNWAGTPEGLREIELKSFIRATSTTLSSIKSRLYNFY